MSSFRSHVNADNLQYVFKIPTLSTYACFESCVPLVNECVNDTLFTL